MRKILFMCFLIAGTTLAGNSPTRNTQESRPKANSVSGKWIVETDYFGTTIYYRMELKQDGEKLTGHYSSMLVGEADLTGTVKGQAIEFTVRADVQGTPLEFKFIGTIENKDSMKGKLDTGGLGDATFSGKRKEPEAKKP